MAKVKRIPNCCPHKSLPKGLTWAQAKKLGWKRGANKTGTVYFCPKT